MKEGRLIAVATGFMGRYPDISWAARIGYGSLGSIDTLVDIRGSIDSTTLSRNGDVATKSTIGVLVVQVPIGTLFRLADYMILKAFASRSCNYAFREPEIGL